MPKKPFFSKHYPPGLMTIFALIFAVAVFFIVGDFIKGWYLLIIFLSVWIVFSVVGEIWQFKKRKPFKLSGEIVPNHPLAKWAFGFAALSFVMLIVFFILTFNICVPCGHLPENICSWNGWTWWIFNAFSWNIGMFSFIAMALTVVAFFRAHRDKNPCTWLCGYAFGIALIVFFFFITEIDIGLSRMNENLLHPPEFESCEIRH